MNMTPEEAVARAGELAALADLHAVRSYEYALDDQLSIERAKATAAISQAAALSSLALLATAIAREGLDG